MKAVADAKSSGTSQDVVEAVIAAAEEEQAEDVRKNRAIGLNGVRALLEDKGDRHARPGSPSPCSRWSQSYPLVNHAKRALGAQPPQEADGADALQHRQPRHRRLRHGPRRDPSPLRSREARGRLRVGDAPVQPGESRTGFVFASCLAVCLCSCCCALLWQSPPPAASLVASAGRASDRLRARARQADAGFPHNGQRSRVAHGRRCDNPGRSVPLDARCCGRVALCRRLTALPQRDCEVHLLRLPLAGKIDAVIVGADRVAANGDTANKIGTYCHAVSAKHHGVPFYVAAPRTTLDPATPTGASIVIEQRPADEITHFKGQQVRRLSARRPNNERVLALGVSRLPPPRLAWKRTPSRALRVAHGSSAAWASRTDAQFLMCGATLPPPQVAAPGIGVWNPSFDVTPAHLISGIITEAGVLRRDAASGSFPVPAHCSGTGGDAAAGADGQAKRGPLDAADVVRYIAGRHELAQRLGGAETSAKWAVREARELPSAAPTHPLLRASGSGGDSARTGGPAHPSLPPPPRPPRRLATATSTSCLSWRAPPAPWC